MCSVFDVSCSSAGGAAESTLGNEALVPERPTLLQRRVCFSSAHEPTVNQFILLIQITSFLLR